MRLPINDYLRDDTLLVVTHSDPWFADIVNYMVAGYVPPGETKEKSNMKLIYMVAGYVPPGGDKRELKYKAHCHWWDDPYLHWVYANGLLWKCVPMVEAMKIIERCHASPYGGHYGAFCTNAKI
jgi:hypothetical protein